MSSGALFEGHVQPGPQLQDVPQVQDVPQLQAEFPQTSLFVGLLEAAYEQLGPQLHAAPHAHAEPVQHKSETNASPAVGPFDRLEQLGPQDATSRLTSDSDVATSETLSRVAHGQLCRDIKLIFKRSFLRINRSVGFLSTTPPNEWLMI